MTEDSVKNSKFKVCTTIVRLYLAIYTILNPKLKHVLFSSLLLVGVVFISCEKPPELPNTPSITFESVRFATGPSGFDSLIVAVGFQDGREWLNGNSFVISQSFPLCLNKNILFAQKVAVKDSCSNFFQAL